MTLEHQAQSPARPQPERPLLGLHPCAGDRGQPLCCEAMRLLVLAIRPHGSGGLNSLRAGARHLQVYRPVLS